jgi:putative N6-adenine-specific DNA methylase
MPADNRFSAYIVAAPGLEAMVGEELRRLSIRDATVHHGGVGCSLTPSQLGLVHLQSRLATRVLIRISRFPATSFRDLEGGLRAIDWSAWLPSVAAIEVKAACSGSKLFHEGAVEERVNSALAARHGEGPPQRIYVRLQHDVATVSIDATGDGLHRRGWRQSIDQAPLRESLAAALLMVSGWDRKSPLLDPFCGSGTIPIEAALMARRVAPGRNREFAFHTWPRAGEVNWDRLVTAADADVIERTLRIVGSDTAVRAIDAARGNAQRAGVADTIAFECRPAADTPALSAKGWIVTNPPYGERVGGAVPAWQQLAALVDRSPGWRGAVVAPLKLVSTQLRSANLAPATARIDTANGGIRVQLTPFDGTDSSATG